MDRNAYDGSIVCRTDGDAGYGSQQKKNQIRKFEGGSIHYTGDPDRLGRHRC